MKEASAMLSREGVEACRYRVKQVLQGAGGRLSQMCFKFGERQFDRIEVGAVGRQVADAHSTGREQTGDMGDFMGGEVVEDQRVALAQLGTEHLLKISGEDIRIDGSIDQKGGFDAIVAQGRDEGGTLPVAVRNGAGATLPHGATPVVAGHLGVQTSFIDKHQPADIPTKLLTAPKLAGGFDVRPILLGGARRFFYSSDRAVPDGATKQ
jgi:hypothetical protein